MGSRHGLGLRPDLAKISDLGLVGSKEMEIQKIDQQVSALKRELKSINDGNSDMM